MNSRKGLSQILFLIIAASVLMMIAMVITFTATDTIGNLGTSSSEDQCVQTLQGKCGVQSSDDAWVNVPNSCFSDADQTVITNQISSSNIWDERGTSGSQHSTTSFSPPYYIQCGNVP